VRVVRGGIPRPSCPRCGFVFFASPGVGAACVIRDAAGRVLLVRRGARAVRRRPVVLPVRLRHCRRRRVHAYLVADYVERW